MSRIAQLTCPPVGILTITEEPNRFFRAITTYLEDPSLEPAKYAKMLTELILPQMDSLPNFRSALMELWTTVSWIAKQLSYDDTLQSRLAELIVHITHVPRPNNRVSDEWDKGDLDGIPNLDRIWNGLPMFKNELRLLEYSAPLDPPISERGFESVLGPGCQLSGPYEIGAAEWTRLNAFIAKLAAAISADQGCRDDIYVLHYITQKGQSALMDSLEAPTPADHLCPAAACWIIFAGRLLYSFPPQYLEGSSPAPALLRLPWSCGELYKGRPGLNPEHWKFWHQRLNVLKDDPRLSLESRDLFKRAEREMTLIEQEHQV
jgi:hypothetical protein